MRVLLLHQHFKTPISGGAIRSYYLAKALLDAGITPIVITSRNQHRPTVEVYEGITIYYLAIPYDNKFGFFSRIVSFVRFSISAIRCSNRIEDINYCYAISVPLTIGLTAMWLKWRRKIPYFFEVGDLWPEAPIQMGFIKSKFLKSLLYSLERNIYKSAFQLVALSPAIKSDIETKVSNEKVVSMIPNIADCEFYKPTKRLDVEQNSIDEKFVVSYIGALGLANGLDYFLACASASQKAQLLIHFMLCGEGAMRDRLMTNASALKLRNITFVDFQDREGVKSVLNRTDAAFVCYKTLPVLETGSPNKFFDGLAAGKLIIVNFGGWIKKEIEEARCGIFVDPMHPTDFVKKISPFIADEKQLRDYQEASRQLAERKYSRVILSERFVKLFS